MKLVTIAQMRAVEREANEKGLTYDQMMENAGHNLAREVLELLHAYENCDEMQILGLVGPGNNGGDALVALSRLAEKGWIARAYLVNRKEAKDPLVKRLEEAGGEIHTFDDDVEYQKLQAFVETSDVLLDGILGTGIKLPLKGDVEGVLAEVKKFLDELEGKPILIAVDCPSGVDSDTGEASAMTLPADATVTMAAIKRGMLALPAYELAGEIRLVDIGDLENLDNWKSIQDEVADEAMASELLPSRSVDAHKGTFGTAMIAAGSVNYTGAALLAGKAAYRVGAGLVTLAVPAPLHGALAGHFPEATWLLLPHELGVISDGAVEILAQNLERATALLVGPGLCEEETTREFMRKLITGNISKQADGKKFGFVQNEGRASSAALKKDLPALVLDADGLKLLAKIENWPKCLPKDSILTPHPGEMSILTGLSVSAIQKDRLAVARKYSIEWGQVVVLKGAFTVIASPDGKTCTIPVATPALARAGTGDVLAGAITGLRAQGMNAYDSARSAAWIHAQAGMDAELRLGSTAAVLAGDVLESIVEVLARLQ